MSVTIDAARMNKILSIAETRDGALSFHQKPVEGKLTVYSTQYFLQVQNERATKHQVLSLRSGFLRDAVTHPSTLPCHEILQDSR